MQALVDLRAAGWAVAVHNDYRLSGEPYTFWLFTKGERAIKGEGRTDEEALAIVARKVAAGEEPQAPYTPPQQSMGPVCTCAAAAADGFHLNDCPLWQSPRTGLTNLELSRIRINVLTPTQAQPPRPCDDKQLQADLLAAIEEARTTNGDKLGLLFSAATLNNIVLQITEGSDAMEKLLARHAGAKPPKHASDCMITLQKRTGCNGGSCTCGAGTAPSLFTRITDAYGKADLCFTERDSVGPKAVVRFRHDGDAGEFLNAVVDATYSRDR